MVSASNAPATQFSIRPRQSTEPTASTVPKARASSGVILPFGIGRAAVRAMHASISASYHIFSAPAAPAPTAMQMSAAMARTGCMWPGAATSPTSAVNTTRNITRGFISAKYSATSPPSAVARTSGLGFTLASAMPAYSPKNVEGREQSLVFATVPITMRSLRPSSFDPREGLVAVEARRRRQRPFERGGADAPRICRRFHLAGEGLGDAEQEHEEAGKGDV